MRPGQDILIEGNRIKAVGAGLAVPAGARIIDLRGQTVLPGLIDCHTHITMQPENYYSDAFRKSPIDMAVTAHVYARRTLLAGFTTVREAGAAEYIDVALRKAIDAGQDPGPRIRAAGLAIGATGGHGDLNGFSPYLRFEQLSNIADGVDEIRKLVRRNVKYGADLIKMIATAGVLSEEESVGAPQFSLEEMKALVEEAAMWHRKVVAHAHGTEGIKRAIQAGVASIDHGSFIDDEGIRMMKERGTYLVADIYNDDYILAEYARLGYPREDPREGAAGGPHPARELQEGGAGRGEDRLRHRRRSVSRTAGTRKQFRHMVEWGMTPMQAIQAATVNAADLHRPRHGGRDRARPPGRPRGRGRRSPGRRDPPGEAVVRDEGRGGLPGRREARPAVEGLSGWRAGCRPSGAPARRRSPAAACRSPRPCGPRRRRAT